MKTYPELPSDLLRLYRREIFAEFLDMVEASSEKIKVCTPSTDYYRRSDEWSDEVIHFVDAHKLMSRLSEAIESLQ